MRLRIGERNPGMNSGAENDVRVGYGRLVSWVLVGSGEVTTNRGRLSDFEDRHWKKVEKTVSGNG